MCERERDICAYCIWREREKQRVCERERDIGVYCIWRERERDRQRERHRRLLHLERERERERERRTRDIGAYSTLSYEVATMSRRPKTIGLFCKRAL